MALGESLEFLAQIRGWQSEARAQRRAHLMRLSEIGLRVPLEGAAGTEVFLVPREHFADETPEHGNLFLQEQIKGIIIMKDGGIEYAQCHTVEGVPGMQCPKGTRWVSATRMEANAACHVYAVYPRNECGPRVNRQAQQRQ